ncbi:MAG: hypothetical protein IIB94_01520 [Candidatus Marinimicrobia bacterium]|nr:hypothetical protein [Candidatus Neomarinimicrobiota bacterium]
MGRAELLLVLGALAIFGRFSLIVNNALLDNSTRVLQSEFEITGISILQETISEVGLKAFDEASVGSIPAAIPSDFTAASSLGPETGETDSSMYDDIDDYNGLTTTGITIAEMTYTITREVGYVSISDLVTLSSTRSTMKRMNLTLTSDYLSNELNLSYVYSYIRE